MCTWIVKAVQQKSDSMITDIYSEMVFGDMLDIMCLINYHKPVIRQNRDSLFSEYEVTKQQGMVGNNNISLL